MSYEHNHDRIVYVLYDEQKAMAAAYFDKAEAKKHVEVARESLEMKAEVVDISLLRKQILDRLNPLERLAVDPPKPDNKRRG